MATAAEVATRNLRLSAILAAIAWQVLQLIGGYFVGHQLKTNSAYGTFGVVLGLLAWFYLQAQITLYVAEFDVVRVLRLWPRSLVPPPLSDADMRAYQLYAKRTQLRPELEIEVRAAPPAASGAGRAKPAVGCHWPFLRREERRGMPLFSSQQNPERDLGAAGSRQQARADRGR